MDDFSDAKHPHYDRNMPGKAARAALTDINKLYTNEKSKATKP